MTAPVGRGRRTIVSGAAGLRLNTAEADLLRTELQTLVAGLDTVGLDNPEYRFAAFRSRVLSGIITRLEPLINDKPDGPDTPDFG